MMYRLVAMTPLRINTLNMSLAVGQAYECNKTSYEANMELQALVRQGGLKLSLKESTLVARAGLPKRPSSATAPVTKEVHHHHHEGSVDMDALADLLIDRLGGLLSKTQSPPTQAPIQYPQATPSIQYPNQGVVLSEESLVFIPSKILSETDKKSEAPLASESQSLDSKLSEALSALKALRKATKPTT